MTMTVEELRNFFNVLVEKFPDAKEKFVQMENLERKDSETVPVLKNVFVASFEYREEEEDKVLVLRSFL